VNTLAVLMGRVAIPVVDYVLEVSSSTATMIIERLPEPSVRQNKK